MKTGRKISNAHYQRKKTELFRKKLTGAAASDEDILSLLDELSSLDRVLFHEADGNSIQSLYRNPNKLFNDINTTVSRIISGTRELPKLQLLVEMVSLVLEKYKLIPETFSHREPLETIQNNLGKNISNLLETEKRVVEAEKKLQEKGAAFSKLLFPFSEELLDGGAYCVGVEYGPVEGKDSERVRDFFMQNKKAFGIGEEDWVAWGRSGTHSNYSFGGSGLEVRCQDTYGTNNLLVRFGRKLAGEEPNVFANLMWLLGSVSGCAVHFYLNKNSHFKRIPTYKLFDFFESFDALLPGKLHKVSVDLRMASNMSWGQAKNFFMDTSMFNIGDSEFKIEPMPEHGMFMLKESSVVSGTKAIFSAMLHGYADGEYLPFGDANPSLRADLLRIKGKTEDVLNLLEEYRLNIGGVNMNFNLAGSKYPEPVKKYISHILSAFADQHACAAEKSEKRKAGTIDYSSAVTITFYFEKE